MSGRTVFEDGWWGSELDRFLEFVNSSNGNGDPATEMKARETDSGGADAPGGTGSLLMRLAAPSWEDGVGDSLAGADMPSARVISNMIGAQTEDTVNALGASDFLWAWGQFVDHDLDLTEASPGESADIAVPLGDPFFDPFGTGEAVIGFDRVQPHDTGGGPREYANEITGFIDGSNIYGSEDEVLEWVRGDGAYLRLDAERLAEVEEDGTVVTGDVRAAENIALTSIHTLFIREHNRFVDELAHDAAFAHATDDEIFDAARMRVEAVMQAITFNEFLPVLVGEDAFDAYQGYDATVDPRVSVEFSTAVYRLGHTLLSPTIQRLDEDGNEIEGGHIALRDAFFQPQEIAENGGIDPILRGLADGTAQALDNMLIDDVRNFLFGPPGAGGFDLMSLNIQRGRDLGVAWYNDLREAMGLDRLTSFSEITEDSDLAGRLEAVYGDIDRVDAFVGGLAEDAVNGGLLGETFSLVMIDQFTRLRDGDEYWSEGRGFDDAELDALWSTRLSDVVMRNTDVDMMQRDAFMAYNRMRGDDEEQTIVGTDGRDLMQGMGGDDMLMGGLGDDEMMGDAGDDMIVGGMGDDLLRGGAGGDAFVYDLGDAGHDTIMDFDAQDSLMLRGATGWRDFGFTMQDEGVEFAFGEATIMLEGIGWGDFSFSQIDFV